MLSADESTERIETGASKARGGRRITPGAAVLIVCAAVVALAFLLEWIGIIVPKARPIPSSVVVRPPSNGESLPAGAWIGVQGCPDGKGHALFWAGDSGPTSYLVQLPDQKVLCVVSGAGVSWAGGAAIGSVCMWNPGVPLLSSVPILRDISFIGPQQEFLCFKVDLVNYKVEPVRQEALQQLYESSSAGLTMRGSLELVTTERTFSLEDRERARSAAVAHTPVVFPGGIHSQKLLLRDRAAGTDRALFDGKDIADLEMRNSELSNAFFVTDDLVMFAVSGAKETAVWQVRISTGKAEQVWPRARGARTGDQVSRRRAVYPRVRCVQGAQPCAPTFFQQPRNHHLPAAFSKLAPALGRG